jgi:hypothetical protein
VKSIVDEGGRFEEGGGKRSLADGRGTRTMRLVETKTFDAGVVAPTFRAIANEK